MKSITVLSRLDSMLCSILSHRLVARAEDPVTTSTPGLGSRGKTTADRSPNFRPPRSLSPNSASLSPIVSPFSMPFPYR